MFSFGVCQTYQQQKALWNVSSLAATFDTLIPVSHSLILLNDDMFDKPTYTNKNNA